MAQYINFLPPAIRWSNRGYKQNIANVFEVVCADSQQDWGMYYALAEWWYNSTFNPTIQTSPYEALYGKPPPNHLSYLPGEDVDEEVDKSLINRVQDSTIEVSCD